MLLKESFCGIGTSVFDSLSEEEAGDIQNRTRTSAVIKETEYFGTATEDTKKSFFNRVLMKLQIDAQIKNYKTKMGNNPHVTMPK